VANQQPTVKAGGEVKLTVKVARQYDYDGEFVVHLDLPQGTQGVTAEDVTIPAGKDEAELVIKSPADAQPGNRGNLTVKATATFNKTPIVHETKISVTVAK